MLKEKSWFDDQSFSKTIQLIQCHFQMRNFYYSVVEVTEANAACLPFIVGSIFLPMADDQTFSVVIS